MAKSESSGTVRRASVAASLFGTGWPRYFIGFVALAALVIGTLLGIRELTNPDWAKEGALVGHWSGKLAYGPGDERPVVLRLAEYEGGSRGDTSDLDLYGAAKSCGPDGQTDYTLSGKVLNDDGTSFDVGFGSEDPAPGRNLNGAVGTWDGNDLLTLKMRFATAKPGGELEGTATSSAKSGTPSDPGEVVTFRMQRSTEDQFAAAC